MFHPLDVASCCLFKGAVHFPTAAIENAVRIQINLKFNHFPNSIFLSQAIFLYFPRLRNSRRRCLTIEKQTETLIGKVTCSSLLYTTNQTKDMFRFVVALVLLATCVRSEVASGSLFGAIDAATMHSVKVRAAQVRAQPNAAPITTTTSARVSVYRHTLEGEEVPSPVAVAITAVDGSFALHNLPVGFYTMAVDGYNDLVFPTYKLEVLSTASGAVKCRVADNERMPAPIRGGSSAEDPVELKAISLHSYFVPREEYSILSFFKNPMLLMMLFSFGLMGLTQMMPKEEMRKTMKDMDEALESGKKVLSAASEK